MSNQTNDEWLDSVIPKHHRLTQAVKTIIENLLTANNIDFLSVSGRTKDKISTLEKIKRKGYSNPSQQLTDISGIRIVVFLESDVARVSKIISESFNIDTENSSNKDNLLSPNEIGYRSVHFVCDLGSNRGSLPEFFELSGLCFEFQVRTLLQHAWAELTHDRNYKFSGKLPREVQRKMYLYAGMLEIADKGFDEVSSEIDKYIETISAKSEQGNLNTEINSISLKAFVNSWADTNKLTLYTSTFNSDLSELVQELNSFGIFTLADLNSMIREDYALQLKQHSVETSIYGVVRDWMLLKDWRRYKKEVSVKWALSDYDEPILKSFMHPVEYAKFIQVFRYDQDYIDENEYD